MKKLDQGNLIDVEEGPKTELQKLCEKLSELLDKIDQFKSLKKETESKIFEEMQKQRISLFRYKDGIYQHSWFVKSSRSKIEHSIELNLLPGDRGPAKNGN